MESSVIPSWEGRLFDDFYSKMTYHFKFTMHIQKHKHALTKTHPGFVPQALKTIF